MKYYLRISTFFLTISLFTSISTIGQVKTDSTFEVNTTTVKEIKNKNQVEFRPITPSIYNADFSYGVEGWTMADFTGGNKNPFNKTKDGAFMHYDGTISDLKTPGAKWSVLTSVVIDKDGSISRKKESRFAYQDVKVSPNMEYYLEYSYAIKKNGAINPLNQIKVFGEILNGHFDDGKDAFESSKTGPLVRLVGSEVKGKKIHTVVKGKFTAPKSGKISTWLYASTTVDVYIDNIKIYPVHSVVMIDAPEKNNQKLSDKDKKKKKRKKKRKKVKLPKIDLTHWKVTIPTGNKNKPITIGQPAIFDYATDKRLTPYMYNDSVKGALVFHAFPSKATTRNTKYSRSELREQMVPGDDDVNWKFSDGAYLKAKIAIDDVSLAKKGKYKYSRIIILQIHGRLSDDQKALIGQKDNNAPPILKVYWEDGKIKLATKELKSLNITAPEILHDDAWANVNHKFDQKVGFRKFTLEIKISKGKMVVILNENEFKIYKGIHMKKWEIFENYFKAGNYFQSREKDSYGTVRFYELEVKH